MNEVGTQKDRQSIPLVEYVQAVRLVRRQIRALQGWAVMGWPYGWKLLISHCQEKPLVRPRCPYRKPTQVDEERILR